MSSPAPGVSPVPFNSTPPPLISNLTSPPPPDTTNKTASQAPPLPASPGGSPGPAGPSPPVLSALIVGVVLGVLAGVGVSVCVYRRRKRKEAQRFLLAGQPSQDATKGLLWFLLTLNCLQCAFVLGLLICFVSCCVLYAARF